MTPDEELKSDSAIVLLQRIARELTTIRLHTTTAIVAIRDAESEIPEKLRRFMNYTHDVHGMKWMYEELGHQAPAWLMQEIQRVDDRYRQMMNEMRAEGGPINKVIREMAKDPENRWEHTKSLPKPKETTNETRPSVNVGDGLDESGADVKGGEPGSGG